MEKIAIKSHSVHSDSGIGKMLTLIDAYFAGVDPGFEKGGFDVVPKSDTWWRNSQLFMKTPLGVNCRELKIIIS